MSHEILPLLRLENVTLSRGGKILLRDFSLNVSAGDVVQLTGPNGIGKTSLLRLIAGALPPEIGSIFWQIDAQNKASHIYIPPDDRALKAQETVLENLSFWGGAVDHALTMTGLSDLRDQPARKLSAGQKRRLSLARIFLDTYRVWLLDEPLNGLDADAAARLQQQITAHANHNGAVIIAGHQPVANARQVVLG